MEFTQWKINSSKTDIESVSYGIIFRFNEEEVKKVDKFHEKMKLSAEEFDFDYKVKEDNSGSAFYRDQDINIVLGKAMTIMELYLRISNS